MFGALFTRSIGSEPEDVRCYFGSPVSSLPDGDHLAHDGHGRGVDASGFQFVGDVLVRDLSPDDLAGEDAHRGHRFQLGVVGSKIHADRVWVGEDVGHWAGTSSWVWAS